MLLVTLLLLSLLHACSGQLEYFCNNQTVEDPFGWSTTLTSFPLDDTGDLQITILLNTHYGESCDKTTPTGTAHPVGDNIRRWAARTPPSLNIGLRVIDTCGSVSVNTKAIFETVPWSRLTSGGESNEICSAGTLPNNIGIIATQPVGEETLDYLTSSVTPFIIARDGYHNDEMLSSTLNIGHSAEVVYKMVIKLMLEMKWDFITVVHSSDKIGENSYEMFKMAAARNQICIDQALSATLETPFLANTIKTNGVVYLGSEGIGLQLLAGQSLADKTWITTLDVRGLNINNGRVYSVLRSEGDLLTDALAIFGKALTMTVADSSCTSGNMQQCSSIQQFRENLIKNTRSVGNRQQTYTIESNGTVSSREVQTDVKYNVYTSTGAMVANITQQSGVTRQANFPSYHSLCDVQMTDCLGKCGHLNADKYLYIHGDYILIVSLPIHKEKNSNDRWSCTEFTKTGLFRTEAAKFTLNKLREMGVAEVNGKTFGMLVIDSCGDKLKTAGEVYEIIRGREEICDRNGNCLDHKSVVALIGDYSSAVTQQIQTVLREKPLLQISYGASSVTLNDRVEYPYFLRTNPPDDLQAHFMVELIKKIDDEPGSEVTAVNILYSSGLYGRTGALKVREALAAAGICVHMERKVNESGSNNFEQLVHDITSDQADVKIHVLFLDPPDLRNLMDTMKLPRYRGIWLAQGYSLILSDTWNDNQELLADYGDVVSGSFSFKFNADFETTTFKDHLLKRPLPTTTYQNPWLAILDQITGNCKLPGNFLGTHVPLCTRPTDITQYADEAYSLHMMKAITAAVHGLRLVAFQHEQNPFGEGLIESQYDQVLRVRIPDSLERSEIGTQPFTQRDSSADTYGNGRVGYTIYNINNNKEYVEVLQTGFSSTAKLGEFKEIVQFYENGRGKKYIESISPSEHCLPTTTPDVMTTETKETQSKGLITGFSLGIGLFVVLGVAAAVVLIMWYRKKRKNSTDNAFQKQEIYEDLDYRGIGPPGGLPPPNFSAAVSDYDNRGLESDYKVPSSLPKPAVYQRDNPAFDGSQACASATRDDSQWSAAETAGVMKDGDLKEHAISPQPAPRTGLNNETAGSTAIEDGIAEDTV